MTRNILLATLFTLGSALALIVVFLTEKSVRIPEANAATVAVRLERGARDYEQYCATCHGLAGQGNANNLGAPRLNNIVQRYTTKNAQGQIPFEAKYGIKEKYGTMKNYIEATLVSGIRGTPMPAWGQTSGGPLRMDQIENITAYVLSWNGAPPESAVALAETVAAQNQPTADPNATPLGRGQALFTSKTCAGCHAVSDQKLVGPGLGGLFQPGGTKSFGTKLPNGKDVNDANVKEWILQGSEAFPGVAHQGVDGETYGQMPAIALTDEEYQSLLIYLKAIKRDGTLVPGADKAQPTAPAGSEKPTVQPTSQPGNSPGASGTTPAVAPGGSEQQNSTTTP
jgi:cytochrome c oxidase cbb3-type subunit 3